jgi:hypothetical protein
MLFKRSNSKTKQILQIFVTSRKFVAGTKKPARHHSDAHAEAILLFFLWPARKPRTVSARAHSFRAAKKSPQAHEASNMRKLGQ